MIESPHTLTRLSDPSEWSLHCYFDIPCESPDGSLVTYYTIADDKQSGRVMVVDRDGTDRRAVGPVVQGAQTGMEHHGGARQQWCGSDRIIYCERGVAEARSMVVSVADGSARSTPGCIRMAHPGGKPLALSSTHELGPEARDAATKATVFLMDIDQETCTPLLTVDDILAIHPLADQASQYEMQIKHTKWAPDGERFFLVYHNEHLRNDPSRKHRLKSLIVIDADGSNIRYIKEFGHHPMWGADSRTLLSYDHLPEGGQGYVRQSIDGGKPEMLMADAPGVHPSFSPDDSMVVTDEFHGRTDGRGRVLLLHLCSGDVEELAVFDHPDMEYDVRCHPHPVWSRDGKRVYFNCVESGTPALYALDLP